ncbi:MAG TPA: sodium:solute symporter, partial [Candidatus Marinimicrobia bacterium]|nr:sodium:solute symporter [Candidatus Neomarinimicrobiota bacterium]
DLYYFPLILLISLAGALIGTYRHPPTDEAVLKKFYKTVRPWGFWKPIHEKVVAEDPNFVNRSSWKRDLLNVLIGIIWQTTLVALPIYFVLKKFGNAGICLLIIIVTSIFLKKNWYDKMEDD